MPRRATHPPVPRVNLDVIRRAYRQLPQTGESDFYIQEKNSGLSLRVRRTVVQLGVRLKGRFHNSTNLSPDMSLEQVEESRRRAIQLLQELEGGDLSSGPARGRSMTLAQLYEEFIEDFKTNRGSGRSKRTFESYSDLWRVHILPHLGQYRISDLTPEIVLKFKREVPRQVLQRYPSAKGAGRPVANRALQQLDAALNFAKRMEWIRRNPASASLVPRYDEERAAEFLDAKALGAIGHVLRSFEDLHREGRSCPVSMRTIVALRVAIYTGVRHRSELLWTLLEWCHLDSDVPRIGIPRAKGDRVSSDGGRWIFLGPEAARLLKNLPRPAGFEHLTIPGEVPGKPLYRLNKAWSAVLRAAGLPPMAVKALRHTFSTHSVGIIAPEHRSQLLGHEGHPITDAVYLHRHGPDLARAAALVETHLRRLLGDEELSLHRNAPSALNTASQRLRVTLDFEAEPGLPGAHEALRRHLAGMVAHQELGANIGPPDLVRAGFRSVRLLGASTAHSSGSDLEESEAL